MLAVSPWTVRAYIHPKRQVMPRYGWRVVRLDEQEFDGFVVSAKAVIDVKVEEQEIKNA